MNRDTIKAIGGSLIVTLFGVYVLMLFYSGKINFYIHPRYTDFAVAMAWVAIVFGVIFLIRFIELKGKINTEDRSHDHESHDHDHIHHNHGKKSSIFNSGSAIISLSIGGILIVLPLALGFTLPVKPLSVLTAQQRAIDLNGIRSGESTASLFLKNTKTYTLGDWIKVINNNPDLNRFVDKEVKVSGFVFSPENSDHEFLVSRFLITCCAVDARPLGLWVEADWQGNFRENQWVEVEGIFSLVEKNGQNTLRISPKNINLISEPANPYVF